MSNDAQENVRPSDNMSKALLNVNKMLYQMPPALGIAQRRNHRTDYFQNASYKSGEVMVLDCQLGSDFCNPKNSYIKINVKTEGGNGGWGSGSVANIINRVLVKTRSGKEWCRLENANLITKFLQRYECEKDWLDTIGKSQGYNDSTNAITNTSRVYILPLWCIPCFNTDVLLPPQIMSGLRIEIYLERTSTCLDQFDATVIDDYIIDRPEIHYDSYDIADAYKRKIAEMATSQGLNLLHKEYFHTIVSAGSSAQTDFNFDIKKAASKALKVIVITRDNVTVTDGAVDSMASKDFDYIQQQAHIGSSYFPQAPLVVDNTAVAGNGESYYQTMFVFGKTDQHWSPPSVTPLEYTNENSLIAFNLNKSHVNDLQGYVVNTARAVLVDLKGNDTTAIRRLDVYLCHLRAAKVYVSNVEIRD
jgi:hypothetical protein